MKKPVLTLLAILMVFALATCAAAETWTHAESGVTIDLPQDMTAEDLSEGDLVSLMLTGEDPAAPLYLFFIEYDETFADMKMEDLSAESLQTVAEYFALDDSVYAYQLQEAGEETLLVMADEGNTAGIVIALRNGWFISVATVASEGHELAESAYDGAVKLMEGIHLPE